MYIPALRYDWLTRLYDPLLQVTMREVAFKQALVKQALIEHGDRVLDLGCGTATLTILLKQTYPNAEVIGLDGDASVLKIARTKLAYAQVEVQLRQGMSYDLPYPDNTFDRVLSSLLFHHLTHEQKEQTAREVLRVLRPGGGIHIADWGKAQDRLMRFAFLAVQLLDGFQTTKDNVCGLLPEFWRKAGFENIQEKQDFRTLFGTLTLYQARKPGV